MSFIYGKNFDNSDMKLRTAPSHFLLPLLYGITPVAFGYGINSANKYYCTALVISEFH